MYDILSSTIYIFSILTFLFISGHFQSHGEPAWILFILSSLVSTCQSFPFCLPVVFSCIKQMSTFFLPTSLGCFFPTIILQLLFSTLIHFFFLGLSLEILYTPCLLEDCWGLETYFNCNKYFWAFSFQGLGWPSWHQTQLVWDWDCTFCYLLLDRLPSKERKVLINFWFY